MCRPYRDGADFGQHIGCHFERKQARAVGWCILHMSSTGVSRASTYDARVGLASDCNGAEPGADGYGTARAARRDVQVFPVCRDGLTAPRRPSERLRVADPARQDRKISGAEDSASDRTLVQGQPEPVPHSLIAPAEIRLSTSSAFLLGLADTNVNDSFQPSFGSPHSERVSRPWCGSRTAHSRGRRHP